VVDHPALFASAADRLAKQVPLVAQADVTLSAVLSLYRRFLEARWTPLSPGSRWRSTPTRSCCPRGRRHGARRELPAPRLGADGHLAEHEVQLDAWQSRMRALLPREAQDASVGAEIARHGLANVPSYELHRTGSRRLAWPRSRRTPRAGLVRTRAAPDGGRLSPASARESRPGLRGLGPTDRPGNGRASGSATDRFARAPTRPGARAKVRPSAAPPPPGRSRPGAARSRRACRRSTARRTTCRSARGRRG